MLRIRIGFGSGSCPSSKWGESENTGLQILHYSSLSLYAADYSHPWLHFEPPQTLSFYFYADPNTDFDLDADPDPAFTLMPIRTGSDFPKIMGIPFSSIRLTSCHVIKLSHFRACPLPWTENPNQKSLRASLLASTAAATATTTIWASTGRWVATGTPGTHRPPSQSLASAFR